MKRYIYILILVILVISGYLAWFFVNTVEQKGNKENTVASAPVVEKEQIILTDVKLPPVELPVTQPVNTDRCFYKNQTYTPGDILKTEQGWIRCTPTIVFSSEKPELRTQGAPAWTVVQ